MGLEVPMSIILDDSREVFDRPRLSVGISDDHIVLMTYTRVENDSALCIWDWKTGQRKLVWSSPVNILAEAKSML